MKKTSVVRTVLAAALAFTSVPALAADHGDVPTIGEVGRQDANIVDLYVFTRGENLVLAIGTNAAIPPGVSSFRWAPDVRFTFHLDHKADVSFDDPANNAQFGGSLNEPGKIQSRIKFIVGVDESGQPYLEDVDGVRGHWRREVKFYAGLRDDAFIRGPRMGRNVNAIVIEVPLKGVQHSETHQTFVAWATSETDGGEQVEIAGRSLRSMFPANRIFNTSEPADHYLVHGRFPDVAIFDASRPASYPNGRELTDDVVDLTTDSPLVDPTTVNDKPFLASFPYLPDPH